MERFTLLQMTVTFIALKRNEEMIMHIKKTNIKLKAILSLIAGFAIAILTRLSVFVCTTDFSYIKIGYYVFLPKMHLSFSRNPNQSIDMLKYIGKKVLGFGGFPFSTFSKCSLERSGSCVFPICKVPSTVGESSILLNTVFWSTIVFSLLLLFSRRRN